MRQGTPVMRWPLWVVFLGYAVPSMVFRALVDWSLEPRLGAGDVVLEAVVFAVPFGGLTSLGAWWMARQERSAAKVTPEAWREINDAVRRGEAPRDPDLDGAVLALVGHRRTQNRQASWAGPLIFGAFGLGAVALLVLDRHPGDVVLVVLWVVIAVALAISVRRRRARLDRVEQAVRARSPG